MSSKKGGKKSKKKNKAKNVPQALIEWDNIGVDEMKDIIHNLKTNLSKLRKERNLTQTEYDTIRSYYDVAKKNYQDIETEIKSHDLEVERVEDENRVEKKVYSHKVRYLNYDHKKKLKNIEKEKDKGITEVNTDHETFTQNMLKKGCDLKIELQEMDGMNANRIKLLRLKQRKEIEDEKKKYAVEISNLQKTFDDRLENLRNELDLKEVFHKHEVKERKNLYINDLNRNHKMAVDRLSSYFEKILNDHSIEIEKSNDSILRYEQQAEKAKEEILFISKKNDELKEPLDQATAEVRKLSDAVRHQEKDKQTLYNSRARKAKTEQILKRLRLDYDDLETKFQETKQSRDELYQRYEECVSAACKKNECKKIILERHLGNIMKDMAFVSSEVNEIIKVMPLDTPQIDQISSTLELMLREKNRRIEELQVNLAKETKLFFQEKNK